MVNDLSKLTVNPPEQVSLNHSGGQLLYELNINLDIQSITERAHYRAVKNWLGKYNSEANASNWEQVQGYLEAWHTWHGGGE